jgi:hypothetical protein
MYMKGGGVKLANASGRQRTSDRRISPLVGVKQIVSSAGGSSSSSFTIL